MLLDGGAQQQLMRQLSTRHTQLLYADQQSHFLVNTYDQWSDNS